MAIKTTLLIGILLFARSALCGLDVAPGTFVVGVSGGHVKVVEMDYAAGKPNPIFDIPVNGQIFSQFAYDGMSRQYGQSVDIYALDAVTSSIYLARWYPRSTGVSFQRLSHSMSKVPNADFVALSNAYRVKLGVTTRNDIHIVEVTGDIQNCVDGASLDTNVFGHIKQFQLTATHVFDADRFGNYSTLFDMTALTDTHKLLVIEKTKPRDAMVNVKKVIDLNSLPHPKGAFGNLPGETIQMFADVRSVWLVQKYSTNFHGAAVPEYFVRQLEYGNSAVSAAVSLGRNPAPQILDADFKNDYVLLREDADYTVRSKNGSVLDRVKDAFSPLQGYLKGVLPSQANLFVLHLDSITPNYLKNSAWSMNKDYDGVLDFFYPGPSKNQAGPQAAAAPTVQAPPKPLNLIDPETKEDFEAIFKRDILFKTAKVSKQAFARGINSAGKGNLKYFLKDLPADPLDKLGFYYNTDAINPKVGTENDDIDLATALEKIAKLLETGVCEAKMNKAKP